MSASQVIPLSVIKIRIPPRRRETISRLRLITSLYDQLDKSLLFVIAPAGYGKTSLLIDLAGQVEMPYCWFSLDALDQDPQRFLRYLIAAIAEKFPGFGKTSLSALEGLSSLAEDQEQVLVTLSNEIISTILKHFILVLDDFHFVEAAPAIGQILGRLLQLAGDKIHMIIASRNLPDLMALPLMIARNQVGGLSFKDLAFQVEEIQTLFNQNYGLDVGQQEAETLLQETEGWVAALHLSKGMPGTLPQFKPLVSTSALFDFFSREVMDRQPESLRQFMLLTSMFDIFNIGFCERVLTPLWKGEIPDWSQLFQQIQAENLFSHLVDDEGRWMRYHHLFQHYLRAKLQHENPALAWSIQQRLAVVYEEQQAWDEALQIYDRLNDHQNLVRLLVEIGYNFIGAGQILSLENWLNKLPTDQLYSRLVLISLLGVVRATQGDQRQALDLLNWAEAGLRDLGNQREWVFTLVRRAEVNRQLGDYAAALIDVQQIQDLNTREASPDIQIAYAESLRIRGLALFGQGRVQDSLSWMEDSLHRYKQLGQSNLIPILETELGVIHRRLGEPQITARYYASALQSLEQSGNTGWKARLLNNMGMLKYMTGQLEEAYPLLDKASRVAGQCGYVRIQTNALISLGDLLTDLSDLDSAFACYDQALTQASNLGHSLYIFYASLGEARIKRLRGDVHQAVKDLRHVELSQARLGSFERAFFVLELGHCMLEDGKLDIAAQYYMESANLFGEGGNQTEEQVARFWQDVLQWFVSSISGIDHFSKKIPPQREWRSPTPLMINAGRAAMWLKKMGQTRLLKNPSVRLFFEHAIRLVDHLLDIRKDIARTKEHEPDRPRLEIISFGEVQVFHDGRLVELSDWQTREARDLFIYLLQSPPLTKEQIAKDFWPDLSPARIKTRFKINMFRVRQALGQDVILFRNNQYLLNRSLTYAWDCERLDSLLQASGRRTVIQERIDLLEQALGILKGQYLEGVEAFWAEADRIRYMGLQKGAMLDLAEFYLRKNRIQDCLQLTQKLLELDPLLEAAHRLVLRTCAAKHDPAGLARQYYEYQKILEDELGMLPSVEMRALYEKLLADI